MDSSSSSYRRCSDVTSAAAHSSGEEKNKKKKGGSTVKLSTDPQSVAARNRRLRINDRAKTLQSIVPGAGELDMVSLLEQTILYINSLEDQIRRNSVTINFVDHPSVCAAQPKNCDVTPFPPQGLDICDEIYSVDQLLAECGQFDLPKS